MMGTIRGRVRKFGENVDTDTVAPAPYLQLPAEEMVKYAFGPATADFYKTVREGDVIVAGNNFGCGSSREQATQVVKDLGIRIIVADTIARIYYRNCIALGLFPIAVKGVSKLFEEGDEIEVDLDNLRIRNIKTGKEISFEPLAESQREIIAAGGILPLLKKMTS
jgi:3-isopropylmalate/(R)-2-methylmalate dehydratase small subunit